MSEGQRIDKWLWHARFARTRTAAQRLIKSGSMRINTVRSDSVSRLLKVGDVLTFAAGSAINTIRVCATADRRGPASEARLLYETIEVTPINRPRSYAPSPGAGPRPNARDRRLRQELKRKGVSP